MDIKPTLIALSAHNMGAGKTTVALTMCGMYPTFNIASFAGPLKQTAMKITPDGRIDKARDRALLQFLGTDYFRKIDPDWWTKKFAVTTRNKMKLGADIVVDDCRFPNERAIVREMGGYNVFVLANKAQAAARQHERDGVIAAGITGHVSETVDLDPYGPEFDWVLDNSGPLEDLPYQIHLMTQHFSKLRHLAAA